MYQPTPSLRLVLGLGDQELEQRLRPAFDAADDVVVVAQCLSAEHVLQAVQSRQVDAVVVAWSLHRLSDGLLDQLERWTLPVALLVPDPLAERWRRRRGPVLSLSTDEAAIRQALVAAGRGEPFSSPRRPPPAPESVPLKPADRPAEPPGGVIAVAGGAGSPGRTTVAISLAAALAAAGPTVLLEADFCAPTIAAFLDRDPSRNLCTLAYAVREDAPGWAAAVADEVQPLSSACPEAAVLCGPPKREMRAGIAPAFLQRLMGELAARYRYVVVDVGPDWSGPETIAANHRAVLLSTQRLLLVSAADLVGLWHTRTALDQLERQVGIDRQAVQVVLNRHDRRFHHGQAEVAWHLGAAVAAVIPFDHSAAQKAIANQRPLVVEGTTRASRALLGLAERVHAGRLELPLGQDSRRTPEPPGAAASWWRRWLPGRGSRQATPVGPTVAAGQWPVATPPGHPGESW